MAAMPVLWGACPSNKAPRDLAVPPWLPQEHPKKAIKKHEVMPWAAIWIDLEMIILNEVREKQISYDLTYMWNLK